MNRKSLLENISVAFASQGVAMILSVIQTLLIPKVLGVEQFGYWQLFLFYTSYAGVFSLGLNDGVYLIEGGKGRECIDKRLILSQLIVGISFESLIAIVIVAIALLGSFGDERELVVVCTGLILVVKNTSTYLMYVYQAMNETKKSSCGVMVERAAFLLPLVVLLATGQDSFVPYLYANMVSNVLQLVFLLYFFRDFLGAGVQGASYAAKNAINSMRVGVKLMLSNMASMLILGIVRFSVDWAWGIEIFGEVSLALSLTSFFLSFVSQASMVLFPALRQASSDELSSFFVRARDFMELFFPAVYLLYYPLAMMLAVWLPDYAASLMFFAYLLPVCVFDSKMNITGTTLLKVEREEGLLLKINAITLCVSFSGSVLGAVVLDSLELVIVCAVVAIVARSIYSDARISGILDAPRSNMAIGEVLVTAVFLLCFMLFPALPAFLLSLGAYVFYLIRFRTTVSTVLKALRPTKG